MNTNRTILMMLMLVLAVVGLPVSTAQATQLQDIGRLKGSESNRIMGMGLVVGLKGTGDSGKYAPTIRALSQSMSKLIDANVHPGELTSTKNVAIVHVEATIPANGAREGDAIDIHVSSIGDAKSLKGGRLIAVPLIHEARPGVTFAVAAGGITLQDEDHTTSGIISKGGKMTQDVWSQFYDQNYNLTFVIDEKFAGWSVAHAIVELLNGSLKDSDQMPDIAKAIDQKNIRIAVPAYERNNPAGFINRVMTTYISRDAFNIPARIVINEKSKTIVFTGDVRMSAVNLVHDGITITTLSPNPAGAQNANAMDPAAQGEQRLVNLQSDRRNEIHVADFLQALDQLKVKAEDRIAIIKEIDKGGNIHAQVIYE